MTLIQIPPSGVAAEFSIAVPEPSGMSGVGGVRLRFEFQQELPAVFVPRLRMGGTDGTEVSLMDSAMDALSITRVGQFPEAQPSPAQVTLTVNEGGSLSPGNTVTIYAWGAQTGSGEGALNPDRGGEPSSLTDAIAVGQAEVLTWQEWNRLTGANQGEEIAP